jgi:hypothetical protein
MSAPIPLRRDFGASQLRGLAKKTKDGPQARRLLALAAIYDGATRSEAAMIGGVGLQITHTQSLAVADQDLVASVADLRTIGLQTCQHPHGVLVGRLAVLLDCWCAGGALLRRSLLLRLSQCWQRSPEEGHS